MKTNLKMRLSIFVFLVMLPFMVNAKNELLYETFESIVQGVPAGWDNFQGTTSATYRWQYSTEGYDRSVCLYFNSLYNTSGANNLLISPTVHLDGDYTLSFYYRNTAECPFKVYVSLDGGATFQANQVSNELLNTGWSFVEIPLTSYNRRNVNVVFEAISNYRTNVPGAGVYLDNVVISPTPICAQPRNMVCSEVSPNNVTITWSYGSVGEIPNSFMVEIHRYSDDAVVYSNNNLVSTSNSVSVSGLEPATRYYAIVQGNCAPQQKGKSLRSEPFMFETLCLPTSLPFATSFEGSTAAIPECMYKPDSYGDLVYIQDTLRYGSSGNSLRIRSTASRGAYISTPLFNHAANDIEVDLVAYATSPLSFIVGIADNPADYSTFEPVIVENVLEAGTWVDYKFNLRQTSYGAQTGKSVFIMLQAGDNTSLYIDDIDVHSIPSCPRLERLKVEMVDSVSAQFSWTEYSSPIGYEFEISIGTTVVKTELVSTQPATIAGLNGNTNYRARVRAICAVGDTSAWSKQVRFTTACTAISPLALNEGFENALFPPQCWQTKQTVSVLTGQGYDYGDQSWQCGNLNLNSGTGNAEFRRTRSGVHAVLVSPIMNVDQADKYVLSFSMYRPAGESGDDHLNVWINTRPDTVGGTKVKTIDRRAEGKPAIYTQFPTQWYTYSLPIQQTGTLYVVFEGVSDYGGSIYIDDVKIELAQQCAPVEDLHAEVATNSSILLKWEGKAGQTYEVEYALVDAYGNFASNKVSTSADTLLIEGLTSCTVYSFNAIVKAICAGNDTSESAMVAQTLQTDCGTLTLPFCEDFEGSAFPPAGWNMIQTNPGVGVGNQNHVPWQLWTTSDPRPYSGNKCAISTGVGSQSENLLATPKMHLTKGDRIAFWTYRPNKKEDTYVDDIRLVVFLASENDTLNLATQLIEVGQNIGREPETNFTGWHKYAAEVTASGDYYVIFCAYSYSQAKITIDKIEIYTPNACSEMFAWDCMNVTSSSFDLVVSEKRVSQWQVSVVPFGHQPTDSMAIVQSCTGASATITGLAPQTQYSVFVRPDCATEWSENFRMVTTLCSTHKPTPTEPWIQSFEEINTTAQIIEGCYDQIYSSSYYWMADANANVYNNTQLVVQPHTGTRLAYAKNQADATLFHAIELEAGVNYEASVWECYMDNSVYGHKESFVSLYLCASPDLMSEIARIVDGEATNPQWTQHSAYFTVEESGVYYMGVGARQVGYSYEAKVVIDDWQVRVVNCIPPTVTFGNVLADTATVYLVSNASECEIKISTAEFDPETENGNLYNAIVTNYEIGLSGLAPNTDYYYSARSICGNDTSEWTSVKAFTTACAAATLPYFDNFESAGTWLCYTTFGEGTAVRTSAQRNGGEFSLKVEDMSVVTPELNTNSLGSYSLQGYAYAESEARFEVGVMTNYNDLSTYEPLIDVLVSEPNEWNTFEVGFNLLNTDDYAEFASARYVVITVPKGAPIYFDDIAVNNAPMCQRVQGCHLTNITATSVDVSWTPIGEETQWRVVAYLDGDTAANVIVPTTTTTISGLLPSSVYRFEIFAHCDATTESAATLAGRARTLCAPVALPYIQSFENMSITFEEQCMDTYQEDIDTQNYPSAKITTASDAPDGQRYLQLWNSKDYPIYFLLPEFALPTNQLRIEFDFRTTSEYVQNPHLHLGVMTDKNDPLSFVDLASFERIQTWTHYFYDLTTVPEEYANARLAFMVYQNDDNSNGYTYSGYAANIDNVVVSDAHACALPTNLNINTFTSETVELTWALSDDYTYDYELRAAGTTVQSGNIDKQKIELTGLQPDVSYTFRVRTNCGVSQSTWVEKSFTLPSYIATAPFFTSFEDQTQNSSWRFANGETNGFYIGTSENAVHSGNRALYVSNDGGNSYSLTYGGTGAQMFVNVAYMPIILDAGPHSFSYNWICNGYYTSSFARVFLAPANFNFFADALPVGYSYNTLPAGCIAMGDYMNNKIDWQLATGTFDVETSGTYYLVAIWQNAASCNLPPLALDDISINALKCGKIDKGNIVSIGSDKVSFEITFEGATVNDVSYKLIQGSNVTTGTLTIADDIAVLTGLQPQTEYTVELTPNCEFAGAQTLYFNVKTESQPANAPYTTGFETTDDNDSWTLLNYTYDSSNSYYQYRNYFVIDTVSEAVRTGDQSLYITDGVAGDIVPHPFEYWADQTFEYHYAYRFIHFEPGQYEISYDVKFDCGVSYNNRYDYARVYLISASEDLSTKLDYNHAYMPETGSRGGAIVLDGGAPINTIANWETKSVVVTFDRATDLRFVIQWSNRSNYQSSLGGYYRGPSFAFDNLAITTPSCVGPAITSISAGQTDISVVTSADATDNIEYKVVDANGTTVATATVTGASFTATGLVALSDYTVSVRKVCSSTDQSPWTSKTISTLCDDIYSIDRTNNYSCGFEVSENYASNSSLNLGGCWQQYIVNGSTGWACYSGAGAHTGSGAASLRYNTAAYIVRPFNLEAGKTYSISGYVKSSYVNTAGIAFSPAVYYNGKYNTIGQTLSPTNVHEPFYAEFKPETSGIYMLGCYGSVPSSGYYLTFDDFVVEEVVESPINLTATDIQSESVTVEWQGSLSYYEVQILSNGVVIDQINETTGRTVTFTGLTPATSYKVQARGRDGQSFYSRWNEIDVVTGCALINLPYECTFNENALNSVPACWDVEMGTGSAYTGASWAIANYTEINSRGIGVSTMRKKGIARLTMPAINVDGSDYLMKFNYQVDGTTGSVDSLIIRVSTDNGATFTKVFSSGNTKHLNKAWRQASISLAQFKNNEVIIVFDALGMGYGAGATISIDDISISCFGGVVESNVTICEGENFYSRQFQLDNHDIQPGMNVFELLVPGTTAGVCDTIYRLNLMVNSTAEEVKYDTICQSSVYSWGPFSNLTQAGTYRVDYTAACGCDSCVTLYLFVNDPVVDLVDTICENDVYEFAGRMLSESGFYSDTTVTARGCDSITNLLLTVLPREYVVDEYMCEDETYMFNGQMITATGRYTANYVSQVGCDSIVVLNMTVLPRVVELHVSICNGDVYDFGGERITEAGLYEHSLVNILGCDSIVRLTVTMDGVHLGEFTDYACQGQEYANYGFSLVIDKDTVLERMTTTSYGCDSLIHVEVTFIPTVYDTIDAFIAKGEVYEFAGNTYTESGVYEAHLYTDLGCDSIVTLRLEVGDGVESSYMLPLTLAPNPIRTSTFTYIHHEWNEAEREGLVVEVISTSGQIVQRFEPTQFPIVVDKVYQSGIYTVRVTAGDGQIYVGKLVVK